MRNHHENGRQIKCESYDNDGMTTYCIQEYNENGKWLESAAMTRMERRPIIPHMNRGVVLI